MFCVARLKQILAETGCFGRFDARGVNGMANYFKRTLTQMVGVCISIG